MTTIVDEEIYKHADTAARELSRGDTGAAGEAVKRMMGYSVRNDAVAAEQQALGFAILNQAGCSREDALALVQPLVDALIKAGPNIMASSLLLD